MVLLCTFGLDLEMWIMHFHSCTIEDVEECHFANLPINIKLAKEKKCENISVLGEDDHNIVDTLMFHDRCQHRQLRKVGSTNTIPIWFSFKHTRNSSLWCLWRSHPLILSKYMIPIRSFLLSLNNILNKKHKMLMEKICLFLYLH